MARVYTELVVVIYSMKLTHRQLTFLMVIYCIVSLSDCTVYTKNIIKVPSIIAFQLFTLTTSVAMTTDYPSYCGLSELAGLVSVCSGERHMTLLMHSFHIVGCTVQFRPRVCWLQDLIDLYLHPSLVFIVIKQHL